MSNPLVDPEKWLPRPSVFVNLFRHHVLPSFVRLLARSIFIIVNVNYYFFCCKISWQVSTFGMVFFLSGTLQVDLSALTIACNHQEDWKSAFDRINNSLHDFDRNNVHSLRNQNKLLIFKSYFFPLSTSLFPEFIQQNHGEKRRRTTRICIEMSKLLYGFVQDSGSLNLQVQIASFAYRIFSLWAWQK